MTLMKRLLGASAVLALSAVAALADPGHDALSQH